LHDTRRMAEGWTDAEVSATVDSYFEMLALELSGEPFNKAAHNGALRKKLNERSKAAVEFKHQNISAVLLELGWIPIRGYKPMKNVQNSLRLEVGRRLHLDSPSLDPLMKSAAEIEKFEQPAKLPPIVLPPEFTIGTAAWKPNATGIKRDYVFRDARNRALGLAGEIAVVNFERARLAVAGKSKLADRVEHVAVTLGDGLGYDVLSFEESGAERFIEVKTTVHSEKTPFFISRSEVEASDLYSNQYVLHRLFNFSSKPGHYELRGAVRESCWLRPESFSGGPAATA
jgi:hypothetical protein